MKKKHRDISVNGVAYTWIAREDGTVTIWHNKKVLCNGTTYGSAVVTPKTITDAIEIVLETPALADSVIYDLTELNFLRDQIVYHLHEVSLRRQQSAELYIKLYPVDTN